MIILEEARKICDDLKKVFDFETVGGVWKEHSEVHDIDLAVKKKNWKEEYSKKISEAVKEKVKVEIYLLGDEMFDRFVKVMRSPTYHIISERLMTGLRFSKKTIF